MFWSKEKRENNKLERIANERATERLNERIEQEKKDQREKTNFRIAENLAYRKLFVKMYTDQFPIAPCPHCGSPAKVEIKAIEVKEMRCAGFSFYQEFGCHLGYKIKCSNNNCVIKPETQFRYTTIEEAIQGWERKPANKDGEVNV